MKCKKCGVRSYCYQNYTTKEGYYKRWYRCPSCDSEFTTLEIPEKQAKALVALKRGLSKEINKYNQNSK